MEKLKKIPAFITLAFLENRLSACRDEAQTVIEQAGTNRIPLDALSIYLLGGGEDARRGLARSLVFGSSVPLRLFIRGKIRSPSAEVPGTLLELRGDRRRRGPGDCRRSDRP